MTALDRSASLQFQDPDVVAAYVHYSIAGKEDPQKSISQIPNGRRNRGDFEIGGRMSGYEEGAAR